MLTPPVAGDSSKENTYTEGCPVPMNPSWRKSS